MLNGWHKSKQSSFNQDGLGTNIGGRERSTQKRDVAFSYRQTAMPGLTAPATTCTLYEGNATFALLFKTKTVNFTKTGSGQTIHQQGNLIKTNGA